MADSENEFIGQLLNDVPKRPPAEDCNGRRWDRREGDSELVFVGYCQNRAGKGTDHVGEGRCKFHGGAADNTGRSNGNYQHGAYSAEFGDDLSRKPAVVICEFAEEHGVSEHEATRYLASELLERFRCSEDPRFLGRYRRYMVRLL